MIRARRADVLAHLERHGVPFADDPSNLDPAFTRRLRSIIDFPPPGGPPSEAA